MEKRNIFALVMFSLLLFSCSHAQTTTPGTVTPNTPADPSVYSDLLSNSGDIVGNMLDLVLNFTAEMTFPLPGVWDSGDPIMQKEMCTPTLNAILNMFMIGGDISTIPFLAAAAGLMFIAFIYLLGKVFENKKWVDYSKNELFEMAMTIVVVLLILVPFLKVMGCVDLFHGGGTTYQEAFAYPKDIISSVTLMSVTIYTINAFLQNMLKVKVTQSIFAGFSGSLGIGGDDPSFGSLSQAGMILVMVTGLASLMAYIHELVTYGFVAYLLPIGIIMRFFAPTRKIGGTIIGLVFGMAVLMPIMLAIGHSVIAVNFFPLHYDIQSKLILPNANLNPLPAIKDGLTRLFTFNAISSAQEDASVAEGVSNDAYGNPVE
ncbi:MAG: hypothetical protein NTY68_03455, partial [Candidatus Micrarchaeota archaeon]|nr:hypothetical protein [Candidatus Micrarchaeota archaeon]